MAFPTLTLSLTQYTWPELKHAVRGRVVGGHMDGSLNGEICRFVLCRRRRCDMGGRTTGDKVRIRKLPCPSLDFSWPNPKIGSAQVAYISPLCDSKLECNHRIQRREVFVRQ